MTQLDKARLNVLTPQVKKAAVKEGVAPEFLLEEIKAGRAVLPCNENHENINPVAIGRKLKVKINVNLGNSPQRRCVESELIKAKKVIGMGADTIMDLSTGRNVEKARKKILETSPVPVGTVPLYEILKKSRSVAGITPGLIMEVIEKQAGQGVDFMTLHAGVLRAHLRCAEKRVCGIVSRGGAIMAGWMRANKRENPLYERFDDILKIMKKYDVTVSLGDGLRPGALADASDGAQFGELKVLGSLVKRCRERGVQVMVEGPGHVPIDQIEMNVKKALKVCHDAPFYVLGPLVTDIALGYDHISAAIGAALAARSGAAFLCGLTPSEHISLPNLADVEEGLIAFKIAAQSWNAARGLDGRDLLMSRARKNFDWKKQAALAVSPEKAEKIFREKGHNMENDFCSMCGKKFCAMKNFAAPEGKSRKRPRSRGRERRSLSAGFSGGKHG